MIERPILFSAPMVRALLTGTKTQTRRVVKPRKDAFFGCELTPRELAGEVNDGKYANSPYGRPGDRLWVRETTAEFIDFDYIDGRDVEIGRDIVYRADGEDQKRHSKWRPSIHMPRERSRITLEITGVRIEKLQDISEADAIAEGIERSGDCNWRHYGGDGDDFTKATFSYRSLWESINGAGTWDANPWVWVVEFRRIEG